MLTYNHGLRCWVAECAPGSDLDYGFDWASRGWLEADETLVSSEWTATPVISLSRPQILADVRTSVYAKCERAGYSGSIVNTITTSAGRKDSRSILLICKQR